MDALLSFVFMFAGIIYGFKGELQVALWCFLCSGMFNVAAGIYSILNSLKKILGDRED